jgi:hypothetical protein
MFEPISSDNQEDRGDISIQWIFILLVSLSVIGGIAASVSGLPNQVVPEPRADATVEQDGDEVVITLSNFQTDVDAVTVTVTGSGTGDTTAGAGIDDDPPNNADYNFTDVYVGSVGVIDGVEKGDRITVTGHVDGSSNQLSEMTVGEVNP